ncbi:MAG: DUF429 domain-containing protein [Actinobacteria bacterium]|nr:DUF429 domain-containing protein [Actinomycetota bacterium]MBV8959496.1 DUF429 domain-containing protein [Actinomycetota bacterium]MBV9934734.1 DUF429 domain-containing protein [Actinomycetota bacterium]
MAADGSPTRVVAVDWSGRVQGGGRYRWAAEVVNGELVSLRDGWDIDSLFTHLVDLAERDDIAVGLDFSFSLPAWFLDTLGVADGPALWDVVAFEGEAWLRECAPPFWGRPGRARPEQQHLRDCERATAGFAGVSPKSTFQIGGAGSVGTASLRGMPLLTRLRAAGFAIWPFDDPGWPMVLEVWPRLFTGPVVKSNADARAAYARDRGLPAEVAVTEDAFDAAVAALGMWAARHELGCLPRRGVGIARREGWIWTPAVRSRP